MKLTIKDSFIVLLVTSIIGATIGLILSLDLRLIVIFSAGAVLQGVIFQLIQRIFKQKQNERR